MIVTERDGADWCAYVDGNPDGPCGYGATEMDAIEDLESVLTNRAHEISEGPER